MIDNATWEQIFTEDSPYNIQLLIAVSGGTYLTNTEIAQESMAITEMLSDSTQLKFGGCNASQFRIRIRSSVQNMTGKTITPYLFAFEDADIRIVVNNNVPVAYNKRTEESEALDFDDAFLVGTYKVRTDKPTPDKDYRDISAFDAMERIINEDVAQWYNSLFDTYPALTLKQLREFLLDYFEITYEAFTGVNDSVVVGKTITTTAISAKTILEAICELNGCFGMITRDNKFRCKVLNPVTDKTYLRYKQGQINYQDALANVITQINIVNEVSKAQASIGVAGNTYIINDNVMLMGMKSEDLETIATRLMPVLSATVYRPFTCQTYGDLCVEVGDFIEIPTSDKTVEAYLLNREFSGIQAMRDKLEAKGEEVNGSGATGSSAIISQLNSQMGTVSEKDTLTYYIFRSATELSVIDGADPIRIAKIRYITREATTVDVTNEFKMNVDFSSDSDRCKVYAFYYYDDILLDYQPIETYAIDDYHTWNLDYTYEESDENTGVHTFEVRLGTVGGDATIGIGDANIYLHGQGLLGKDTWDGNIDVSDNIVAIFDGGFVVNIADTPVIGFEDVSIISTPNDVITAIFGGGMTVSLTENIQFFHEVVWSYWVDDEGDYMTDEDDNAIIFMGID